MKNLKRILYYSWIGVVVALCVFLLVNPQYLKPQLIAEFLRSYNTQLLIIYTVVSLVRGFFLLPSTPFVVAGAMLFPEQAILVITISMIGVFVGATVIYYFSDFLGFSAKLEKKYAKQYEKWHKRLNGPKATLIVLVWSFFPLVPTDLICYIAGIVRMRYSYMITGVLIGELVLIYFYVVLGAGFFEYIMA